MESETQGSSKAEKLVKQGESSVETNKTEQTSGVGEGANKLGRLYFKVR